MEDLPFEINFATCSHRGQTSFRELAFGRVAVGHETETILRGIFAKIYYKFLDRSFATLVVIMIQQTFEFNDIVECLIKWWTSNILRNGVVVIEVFANNVSSIFPFP